LKWTTLFLYGGIPIIGWICSLVSLRYYTLDQKKMHEITEKLHRESFRERVRKKSRERKERRRDP